MQLHKDQVVNTIRHCQEIQILKDSGYKINDYFAAAGLVDSQLFQKISQAVESKSEVGEEEIDLLVTACRVLSAAIPMTQNEHLRAKLEAVNEGLSDILPYQAKKHLQRQTGELVAAGHGGRG